MDGFEGNAGGFALKERESEVDLGAGHADGVDLECFGGFFFAFGFGFGAATGFLNVGVHVVDDLGEVVLLKCALEGDLRVVDVDGVNDDFVLEKGAGVDGDRSAADFDGVFGFVARRIADDEPADAAFA